MKLGHRPALDGYRGLAILLVVPYNLEWAIPGGYIGVDLFFVLSGFLITALLLEERASAGRIDFRAFYMRRALRLLPALFFLLIALVAAATVLHPPELARDYYFSAVAALLYVANWVMVYWPGEMGAVFGPLVPTWSLAVEEQFYMVWPPLISLLLAGGFRLRRLVTFSVVGIVLSQVLRLGLSLAGAHPWRIYMGTDTRAGVLLLGCLLAFLFHSRAWDRVAPQLGRDVVGWGALGVVIAAGLTFPDGSVTWVERWGFLGVDVAAALVLGYVVAQPERTLARIMGWRPLVWCGRVSYGLYLWHYPVATFLTAERLGLGGHPLQLVRVAVLVAVVTGSWLFIERPFLARKRRWSRVEERPAQSP